jgi:hypothetical protein
VNVEFLGDLLNRFDALERLKRYAGFEFGIVSSSFALAVSTRKCNDSGLV